MWPYESMQIKTKGSMQNLHLSDQDYKMIKKLALERIGISLNEHNRDTAVSYTHLTLPTILRV